MTTLYRSPNIVIDQHEWHAAVTLCRGRTSLAYRWRPLSLKEYRWSNLNTWVGPKPKRFLNRFLIFRAHIRTALLSHELRRGAVLALRGVSGAAVRNGDAVAPLRGRPPVRVRNRAVEALQRELVA